MPYYLGIDGGGTKTTCALGDDHRLLATAGAGPSNVVRVGEAQSRESLLRCVNEVCSSAGITAAQITRVCIGAAGAASPEISAVVRRILATIVPCPSAVVADSEITLQAAFADGPGIIVIAGTGAIAYGRNAQGETARAGGWGFAISDEGSAHWIGCHAIAELFRAHDRGELLFEQGSVPGHPFASAIFQKWGLHSVGDLVRAANATPAPDFSALFPIVLSCAEAGDAIAYKVLTQAGPELSAIAAIVMERLFPASADKAPFQTSVPVAMAGGVFRHSARVREVFYNELRRRDDRVSLHPEVVDPLAGALELARKQP